MACGGSHKASARDQLDVAAAHRAEREGAGENREDRRGRRRSAARHPATSSSPRRPPERDRQQGDGEIEPVAGSSRVAQVAHRGRPAAAPPARRAKSRKVPPSWRTRPRRAGFRNRNRRGCARTRRPPRMTVRGARFRERCGCGPGQRRTAGTAPRRLAAEGAARGSLLFAGGPRRLHREISGGAGALAARGLERHRRSTGAGRADRRGDIVAAASGQLRPAGRRFRGADRRLAGVARRGPHVVVGHSMGGHVLLRAAGRAARRTSTPRCWSRR